MAIREQVLARGGADRAAFKVQEVARTDLRGEYSRLVRGHEMRVEIRASGIVTIRGNPVLQVEARAFRDRGQLGFGRDGSVEWERIRIPNPPIMVDDPTGPVILEARGEDGILRQRRLREDHLEAIREVVLDTIRVIGKPGARIVPGKVGNTTTTLFSTVDGQTRRTGQNVAWTTLMAGAGTATSAALTEGPYYNAIATSTTNQWERWYRPIFIFDGSSIPDTDVISQCVASFWLVNKQDDPGATPASNIYGATPASFAALANGDFQQTQATPFCDTELTYAGATTGQYNDFTFNAAGIAAISKTGSFAISFKNTQYDVGNTAPAWSSGGSFNIQGRYMEQTGTTNDPRLVIEHDVGGGVSGAATDDHGAAESSAAGAKQGSSSGSVAVAGPADVGAGAKGGSASGNAALGSPASSASGAKGGTASASDSLGSTQEQATPGTKSALGSAGDAVQSSSAAAGQKQVAGSASDAPASASSHSGVEPAGAAHVEHGSALSSASGQGGHAGSGGSSVARISDAAAGFKGGGGSASDSARSSDNATAGEKAAAGAAADFLVLVDAATGFKHSSGAAHDTIRSPSHFFGFPGIVLHNLRAIIRSGAFHFARITSRAFHGVRLTVAQGQGSMSLNDEGPIYLENEHVYRIEVDGEDLASGTRQPATGKTIKAWFAAARGATEGQAIHGSLIQTLVERVEVEGRTLYSAPLEGGLVDTHLTSFYTSQTPVWEIMESSDGKLRVETQRMVMRRSPVPPATVP